MLWLDRRPGAAQVIVLLAIAFVFYAISYFFTGMTVHLINVHLRGAFLMTRAVQKYMVSAKFGRIINISSVAGLIGARDSAAYCASKGGLRLLTKSTAMHCAINLLRRLPASAPSKPAMCSTWLPSSKSSRSAVPSGGTCDC